VAAASTRKASAGSAPMAAAPRGPQLSRPRLGRRQGVAAALHGELPKHGETHERALGIVLRVQVGETRDDRDNGLGHAVGEQRQDLGRDPREDDVDVGGGSKARRHASSC
jgi:hypothetical protein